MESRRTFYYKRNTIEPHIKEKCRDMVKQRNEKIFYIDNDGNKLVNKNKNFPKVVATNKCNWCDRDMKEYRVICPYCHNCQYCGFYSPALNQCLDCGNQAPEEIKIKVKRIKVRDIKNKHDKNMLK